MNLERKMMKKEGLYYKTIEGKFPIARGKILLTIELDGDCCTIRNYFDGIADESYRSTSKEQATVDIVALLNGFQPPRNLRRRDIPSH